MSEDLISKKDILETYEISYGALYRWKRMGLIPEEWFIKRSTVTGQETFFPRQLICDRIALIKTMRDGTSLEALSKTLGAESKKSATLVIDTPLGKKRFLLQDIRSVQIDRGDGDCTDITNAILGGNE